MNHSQIAELPQEQSCYNNGLKYKSRMEDKLIEWDKAFYGHGPNFICYKLDKQSND